jgi:ribosome maturation factor RimP
MADLKEDIQHQLDDLDSQIEVVAVERPGGDALRIYIDHPDGVDLALCEQASAQLQHLLSEYSLEVSSPGPKFRRPRHLSESKELS